MPKSPTRPPTVVYIEDDVDALAVVRMALSDLPLHLIGVTDPSRSLAILMQSDPALLLLDLEMPDVNGWDVLRRIRADERYQQLPVIIVSGRDLQLDLLYGRQFGGVRAFLQKPVNVEDLRREVLAVIQPDSASSATPSAPESPTAA